MTNSRAGARLQQQQQQHGQSAASATGAMATGAAATGTDRHGGGSGVAGTGGSGSGGVAGGRGVSRQESMPTQHTSQWIIDGDELPRADIEVRCALIGAKQLFLVGKQNNYQLLFFLHAECTGIWCLCLQEGWSLSTQTIPLAPAAA